MTPLKTKPLYRLDGVEFEDVEHIVTNEKPDLALCGVDQIDVPWDQGFPPCQACVEVMLGRMN
ncbi:MAG: hypothetical protein ACRDN6_14845 [Gaiellaceae bacterium]